ncbi:MAG: indolepyruvate ferredoxin oxidoreductase subunit alpha [Promethearchaeota archaeon]|jgi:UDP-glucose 4-epimerase
MVNDKEEIEQAFKKMMESSGMITKVSPIYKKDMKDVDSLKVQWKVGDIWAYQIFEKDNYTYKIGEKLDDPDISLVIYNIDLGLRFLKGESVRYEYAPRRDYKGKFKLMHVVEFKDVETEKGPKKQKVTKHFLTARFYNKEFFKHPISLSKLPPFQIAILARQAKKKEAGEEEFGAYIPINQSLGTYENKVIPYVVFEHFIEKASNIVMINCGCRLFHDCKDHDVDLGCIYMGDDTLELMIADVRDAHIGTKEEALDRVRRAIDDGLIPLLGRAMGEAALFGVEDKGHFLSSCFCCTCCCVNGKFITHGPNVNLSMFRRIEGVSVNVDESKCIGCGKCVEVCVFKGRELVGDKAKINQARCLGCGRCAEVCPTGATTITIDDMSRVDELINKIESVVDVRDQASLEEQN